MGGESIFDNCTSLERMVFVGKTIDQVREMSGYPWGFEDKDLDMFFVTEPSFNMEEYQDGV